MRRRQFIIGTGAVGVVSRAAQAADDVVIGGKRKLVVTVDGVSFQAAWASTASLQFQGRREVARFFTTTFRFR